MEEQDYDYNQRQIILELCFTCKILYLVWETKFYGKVPRMKETEEQDYDYIQGQNILEFCFTCKILSLVWETKFASCQISNQMTYNLES